MTKVIVMGKFYKTLTAAKVYILREEAKTKKTQVILQVSNGYLVLPLSQLHEVKNKLIN